MVQEIEKLIETVVYFLVSVYEVAYLDSGL